MTQYEITAGKVVDRLRASPTFPRRVVKDPGTILLVVQVLVELYRLMRWWCGKSEQEVLAALADPGPVGRLLVRRAVRRVAGDTVTDEVAYKIHKAVLAVAAETTAAESAAMFAAAPHMGGGSEPAPAAAQAPGAFAAAKS